MGGRILRRFHHLKVDVHNPDITVTVEVRDRYAFVRGNNLHGAGGMPTGTGGRAAVLISGGIDSPVASYMMAKRGIELVAVHFASPPYTSELAEMKVMELLKKVARYSGWITTFVVPFTEIQEQIRDKCPEEYFTIIMRRVMMMISARIAGSQNCHALITGESVGQVASQTMYALACTDCAADMPVFRPCIGMDKDEIIAISRKIETFETSIEPYEDCCTVFTPKHPKTKPRLDDVLKASAKLLKPGGHFFMVHRPSRLGEIMSKMTACRIEPKRMQLVYPYVDKEPNMVLIEGLRDGKSRMTVEKPLIVYKEPGKYTDEIYDVYGY